MESVGSGRLLALGAARARRAGTMERRQRNRIAPIAGALGGDKSCRGGRTAPTPVPDLCTTCLLFNESVRRYLPELHNKFRSRLAKMPPGRYLQTDLVC